MSKDTQLLEKHLLSTADDQKRIIESPSKIMPVPNHGIKRLSTRRQEILWGIIFISPWILGFLIFYLLPMGASLGFTFFEMNLANPEENRFVGFGNWARLLFKDPEAGKSILRVLIFGLVNLPITFLFTLTTALILNSRHLRLKETFRALFYLPTMIPAVAGIIIWKGILNEHTGWINVLLNRWFGLDTIGNPLFQWLSNPDTIYFTYSFIGLWGIGNMLLVFLAGLQKIPRELYEAADLDGASWIGRLFFITLPQLSSVIFFNVIMSVIGLLQYFMLPFVLNNGDGSPGGSTNFIMVYFYKQAFGYFNMGYGAVLAWVIFLIALLFTVILFRTSRNHIFYGGE